MKRRRLGSLEVPALGLGCMGMSAFYGTTEEGGFRHVIDGPPENVRRSIEGSLNRLGTDHVDPYYLHRVDPNTPVEENLGAVDVELAEDDL